MAWSVRLFRVKGIDVKIHLTFLLILVWAAYRWGTLTRTGQGALFGIVVTLLLFLSVILHELGHSFQAQRFGIPVKHITLWPFGGVAQIERVPEEPRQEQQMATAQVHAIPVTEDGYIAGMLTAADINEAFRLLSASPKLVLGAA